MSSRSALIEIKLDMEKIRDAELYIDANVVKQAILLTPKLKLKHEVRVIVHSFSCLTNFKVPLISNTTLFCSILMFWMIESYEFFLKTQIGVNFILIYTSLKTCFQ